MATKEWLPPRLVDQVIEAAAKEDISPEAFVRDAVEKRLSRAGWRKTLEFGEQQARGRGLRPEDVVAEVAGLRAKPPQ